MLFKMMIVIAVLQLLIVIAAATNRWWYGCTGSPVPILVTIVFLMYVWIESPWPVWGRILASISAPIVEMFAILLIFGACDRLGLQKPISTTDDAPTKQ